ncbi:MAG: hypothetical protein AseanaTS_03550 [Candidatus Pelagadaptatus aseana]|uniref:hypothetical protein n=1 Tax=Candidatus Pelagadaptatus aseana TaxID=3120508 RepID=UPI0039B193B3
MLLSLLITFPLGALLVAALYLRMYARMKSPPSLLAGVLWVGYAAYESLMQARVLCTGECNIRVDLLLLYPLLLLVSLLASVLYFRKKARSDKAR